MKAVTPIPFIRAKYTDRCGKPLSGGKIYTYEVNSTTPKATYADPYGVTPNTNPVVLDVAGEADIYLHGTYRIIVEDSKGVVVNDVDKIGSWYSSDLQDTLDNISSSINDVLVEPLQNLQQAIDAAAAAGAGANGWTDLLVQTWSGRTQEDKNKDNLSLYDFGLVGDGVFHPLSEYFATLEDAQEVYPTALSLSEGIDSHAIQKAIDFCASSNVLASKKISFCGHAIQDKTIVLKSGVKIIGESYATSVIEKKAGFNGRALITEGFDGLTGTTSDAMPFGFAIKNVRFHGRWLENDWKSLTNSYVNTSGGGVFIYGREYELDIDVRYQAGVGVWLEASETGALFDTRYDLDVKIKSYVTKEEGFVFLGGVDVPLKEIFVGLTGAVHKQDTTTVLPRVSPSFGPVNGGRTDGVVIAKGGEIGFIHSWSSMSGYAFDLRGNSRVNADFLMGESTAMGCLDINTGVYGQINRVDAHSNYGDVDGSKPDIWYKSSAGQGFQISQLRTDRNGSQNTRGQTHIQVDGSFLRLPSFVSNGRGQGGHGVVVSGQYNYIKGTVHNQVGNASDDTVSAALVRSATGYNDIEIATINAPLAYRSNSTPVNESIKVRFNNIQSGKVVFEGLPRNYSYAQNWDVCGSNNGTLLLSASVLSVAFDPTITTEQTLSVAHNLSMYSNVINFQCSIVGGTGASRLVGAVDYFYIERVTGTEVFLRIKMSEAVPNTTASINVSAKI